MSSRALRKAQRRREEEQAKVHSSEAAGWASDEEDVQPALAAKSSLFLVLGEEKGGEGDEEDGEADEDEDEDEDEGVGESRTTKTPQQEQTSTAQGRSGTAKKKKKKKGAGKKGTKGGAQTTGHGRISETTSIKSGSQLDDIDLALRSLRTKSTKPSEQGVEITPLDPELEKLSALLAVEAQHLNVANEMRRLFGRAALESDGNGGGGAPVGRRRGRGGQQTGLAGAVGGQHLAGGRGLAGLGLRRNIFIAGKEEWPRGTGGGLGMEVVAKEDDGYTEYRFVHNSAYQDVQRQFEVCVESLDPERMVQLLQFNPYHISTLLQVSEIAKQEQDYSTSGDLLERALFSFGRAVHSSFASKLSQGKAGLDFRRPENREFWLAGWRYVGNLGQRGTWRTAFEWTKLLLSLDPIHDPYCLRLVIDQMALRARRPRQVQELAQSRLYRDSPAIAAASVNISLALAHQQLENHDTSRRTLFNALTAAPWIFVQLFRALNITRIPPSVWGCEPRTENEQLFAAMYVRSAKDLWTPPEATALLMEVAGISETVLTPAPVREPSAILVFEARQALLTDDPTIIQLLPRALTDQVNFASDPLPPSDSIPSYSASPVATNATQRLGLAFGRGQGGNRSDEDDSDEAATNWGDFNEREVRGGGRGPSVFDEATRDAEAPEARLDPEEEERLAAERAARGHARVQLESSFQALLARAFPWLGVRAAPPEPADLAEEHDEDEDEVGDGAEEVVIAERSEEEDEEEEESEE
ncbi:MAG: hypothetical protein M1838_004426 [Thelocarpon superellum]|nr:MAG: hypothetical protein M1838_004426 [Thelocarpon superellum]